MLGDSMEALDQELQAGFAAPRADSGECSEGAGAAPAGELVIERTPAADDTDTLTRQTIAKMCEYIRDGISDPNLQEAAELALMRFSHGRRDARSIAWAVFWFMKHRVKRVLDEGALFRLGESNGVDMLIAPAVLLGMPDAAEDCDGFTMLAAAMCGALGLNCVIVSIACDARDRGRWSHVFLMIDQGSGDWLPLDCSHGFWPGWMVPRERIYRWQAWDLNGNAVDVAPPLRSRLNGYVYNGPRPGFARRPGLGDDSTLPDGSVLGEVDPLTGLQVVYPPFDTTTGVTSTLPGIPTSSGSDINWSSILNNLISSGAKVASVAELPAGSSLFPSGAVVSGGAFPAGVGGLNIGTLLLIGLALGAVALVMNEGGHR